MIVFESKKVRRIVLRLERGEDVVADLEALARRESIAAAWVRGIGTLAWAELDRHDQARRVSEPPQRFDTPCEILALEGNVSMLGGSPRAMLHATLARRTDNGVDILGGRLRAGEVFACELTLECFEDLTLTRARDEQTGLALWTGASERAPAPARVVERPAPARAERPAPARAQPAPATWTSAPHDEDEHEDEPAPTGAVSWADVAAVSAAPRVEASARSDTRRDASELRSPDRQRAEEAFFAEPHPQKGDWIDHRQFGVCRVDREDDEGGLVIRLPSGARKTIKLDFMEVGQPRAEGNRRVFPVRPRKR